uniref:Uncharacterized protein n=1 Tax=Lygus hesperus TaxID=30085 RepID=A0A146MB73_LYGHE
METLLAVGDVEGHVTLFDFVKKKIRAFGRPHVQSVVGLFITNNDINNNSSSSEDNSAQRVFSLSQDRKLAVLSCHVSSKQLTETRGIVLREHVTTCCFENESTLHVGAVDGSVVTYRIDLVAPIQV